MATQLMSRFGTTPTNASIGILAAVIPLLVIGITAAAVPSTPWMCAIDQHPLAPSPEVGTAIVAVVTLVAGIGLARILLAKDTPKSLISTAATFFVATLVAIECHIVAVSARDLEGGLRSLRAAMTLLLGTMLIFASIDALAAALLLPAAGWLVGVYRLHTYMMENSGDALEALRD